jgi:spore germination protein KB
MGTFIKVTMFYYAIVLGTAQWMKLSEYRPLTLPIGFLMVSFGVWVDPSLQDLVKFIRTISPFYFTSIQTVIPMLLLFIAFIRMKFQHQKEAQKG